MHSELSQDVDSIAYARSPFLISSILYPVSVHGWTVNNTKLHIILTTVLCFYIVKIQEFVERMWIGGVVTWFWTSEVRTLHGMPRLSKITKQSLNGSRSINSQCDAQCAWSESWLYTYLATTKGKHHHYCRNPNRKRPVNSHSLTEDSPASYRES